MVVIFVVAISPQAILLVITGVSRDSLIGVDLFDMGRRVFVDDGR
jgi:hypothetical protein